MIYVFVDDQNKYSLLKNLSSHKNELQYDTIKLITFIKIDNIIIQNERPSFH